MYNVCWVSQKKQLHNHNGTAILTETYTLTHIHYPLSMVNTQTQQQRSHTYNSYENSKAKHDSNTHIYIDHINIRLYERGRATKLNKQQDKNEWTNQRKSEEKQYIKIMMMMVQQIYTQNKNTRLFGLFSIKARNNKKISQFPLIFF